MIYAALAATLLPTFAAAQNVFTMEVAKGGSLNFSPNNLENVSNGDIVQFVFDAPAHTVTQSTLAAPCTPLDGGFNSGPSTVVGDVWNLTVSDASKPIWFFCATINPVVHCEQGMFGAINSSPDAFSSFSANAKAATNTPSVTAVVLSGSGAAATASVTSAPVVSGTSPAGSASGGSSAASGSSTASSGTTSSSSAAKPFAGFEGAGAGVLALMGALLF